MYTVWVMLFTLVLLLILDMVWLNASYIEGYALIFVALAAQYFITERRAKYWSVTVDDIGLLFHEGDIDHRVSWESINLIKAFPTASFKPVPWTQAVFSSGSIVYTEQGQDFVVYKKLRGYEELLDECQRNT